jgi:4'-phosphopantetheinyl transferase
MQQTSHAGEQAVWRPGPDKPQLPDGVMHVWRADLAGADGSIAELLSEQERARGARLLSHRDRRLWTNSRGLLRALIGSYLDVDPSTLRFTTGPHGKPALLDPMDSPTAVAATGVGELPSLSFNLSHSGALGLYCFARKVAVGVDVELDRQPIGELALAERMLDAATVTRMRALSDPVLRRRVFLRAWTRHEAQVKCLGTGILAGEKTRERPAWVADLDLGTDAAGAIACQHTPREITYWTCDSWPANTSPIRPVRQRSR